MNNCVKKITAWKVYTDTVVAFRREQMFLFMHSGLSQKEGHFEIPPEKFHTDDVAIQRSVVSLIGGFLQAKIALFTVNM